MSWVIFFARVGILGVLGDFHFSSLGWGANRILFKWKCVTCLGGPAKFWWIHSWKVEAERLLLHIDPLLFCLGLKKKVRYDQSTRGTMSNKLKFNTPLCLEDHPM